MAAEAGAPDPMRPTMTPASAPQRRGAGLADGRSRRELADPAKQWFSATSGSPYNELPTFPVRPSYAKYQSSLHMDSQCVVFDGAPGDPHRPSSTPIYQTATFVQPSADSYGSYDYTRSGNPTRTALEKHVAMLEVAHAAFAFSTGMAALNSVTRLLAAGDELLVGSDIYGGMHRLVSRVTSMHGITVRKVDVTDVEAVRAAITARTRMLHFESPSNPLMQIADVRALAAICREHGVIMSIDASMIPPVLMQCIPLGADIVVHSATKFLAGHSDTMAGVVCCRTEELAKRVAFYQNAEGTGLAPFDCWLVLRGIKTMALRVERAQANAKCIANELRAHPRVTAVHYAGLLPLAPDEAKALIIGKRAALSNSEVVKRHQLTPGDADVGHAASGAPPTIRQPSDSLLAYLRVDIDETHPLPSDEELGARYVHAMAAYSTHFKQASGGGTVISFTTGSVHLSQRIVDALRMFKLTVSFGSCNSLVEMPCVLSHASVPAEQRTIPEDLIRLSVGVENVHDLVTDIQQAFELATHPHVHDVRLVSREGSSAAQSGLIGSPMASPAAGPLPTAAEVEGMRRQLALLSERVEVAEARRAESKQVALETRVFASRVASLSMGAIFIAGALAAGALIAASRRE